MIWRLGERIKDESSVMYWAAKHRIPVFCPAITDGSIGDMIFFHSFKSPGLVVDIAQDVRSINLLALKARRASSVVVAVVVVIVVRRRRLSSSAVVVVVVVGHSSRPLPNLAGAPHDDAHLRRRPRQAPHL